MRKKNYMFYFFTEIISYPALLWKFRTNLALKSRVHTEIFFNLLLGFIQNCYSWEKNTCKNKWSVITYNISLILDSFNKYVTPRPTYFSTSAYTFLTILGRRKRTKPHFLFLCLLNRAQSRNNMVYTETKTHHIHITSYIALAQCFFSLSQNQKY